MRKTVFRLATLFTLIPSTCVPVALGQVTEAQVDTGATSQAAKTEARNFLKKQLLKCGDDYFSKKAFGGTDVYIFQFKELHWDLIPQQLSKTDRLNGIEWRAKIVVRASAQRSHMNRDSLGGERAEWQPWQDFMGPISYRQERTNGVWETQRESLADDFGSAHLTCEEVTKLLQVKNPSRK